MFSAFQTSSFHVGKTFPSSTSFSQCHVDSTSIASISSGSDRTAFWRYIQGGNLPCSCTRSYHDGNHNHSITHRFPIFPRHQTCPRTTTRSKTQTTPSQILYCGSKEEDGYRQTQTIQESQ